MVILPAGVTKNTVTNYVYYISTLLLSMSNPDPIQIRIPKPCNQSWEEMTPDGKGRHCDHCRKTVIDFTTWSDAALYEFFSKNTERVCGRFYASQTGRPIQIPPQPHSRLYRMTIALGLTLVFVQATDAVAQKWSPRVTQSIAKLDISSTTATTKSKINGQIIDDRGYAMDGLLVQMVAGGKAKSSGITESGGKFFMDQIDTGAYEIYVRHKVYKTSKGNGAYIHLEPGITNLYLEVNLDSNGHDLRVERIYMRYREIERTILNNQFITGDFVSEPIKSERKERKEKHIPALDNGKVHGRKSKH